MKMKKVVALLLASVMGLTALAGCGSTPAADTGTQTQAQEPADTADDAAPETKEEAPASDEIVTLKWATVGNGMPKNYDAWKANIDTYLAEKIGVNIEVEVVPWGDWGNRRNVITTTGEEIDILFTDMSRYTSEVQMGAFMDITDLLGTAAPDLQAYIPADYWDAVKIDGAVYAVPTYKDSSLSNYFVWDQAVLDKYGIDPTQYTTIEAMTEPLKTIYDGEGTAPFLLHRDAGLTTGQIFDNFGFGIHVLGVKYGDSSATVINGLEDEEFLSMMDVIHEWYNYGIINADAATTDESNDFNVCAIAQGWAGAAKTTWGPNWEIDAVAIKTGDTVVSNSTVQGSLNAISANCPNPEKALAFLQLMNSDPYVRDSFFYGLEGDDFDYTDAGLVHRNNVDWSMAGYTQGTFFIVTQQDIVDFNQWDEVKALNEEAVASPAIGINFDPTNVETELANVRAVWDKYRSEFMTGTKEPRALAKVITEEMKAAGLDTLLAEVQAQVDAGR